MKLGYITNLRAPYRNLQLNEFSKIDDIELTAYYTDKPKENRKWNINKPDGFKEVDLKGIRLAGKFGYINMGLIKIIKSNDVVILGCYEQPTYIVLSILCRILKKPYILSFDGISTNRLIEKENPIKKYIKNIVVKHSAYIMGNGTVSKRYFSEVFGYPVKKIYNQYLTVDSNKINELYKDRDIYRKEYRKKLNISEEEKVVIYSGRLVDIKNVDSVIKAISKLKNRNIVLLITGGGILENELKKLANNLGVRMIITGFIEEQEKLFKYYFVGDALILPSKYEPWGLVVNEAMLAGLPVIVSRICGCSLDLIKDNGYVIDPFNINDIKEKIVLTLFTGNYEKLGENSRRVITPWNVKEAKVQLEDILNRGLMIK